MTTRLNILFPKSIIGGHESAFIKILNTLPEDSSIYIYVPTAIYDILKLRISSKFSLRIYTYKNPLELIFKLYKRKKLKWLIVSGSPLGHVDIKLICMLMRVYLIEYTAFSDKDIKSDRFHHFFMPQVNKRAIAARILIDDWQVGNSVVEKNYVIKNII